MEIAKIVSLVVNILFVLILAIAFLIGLKRGVAKAGLRIGIFLVFVIIGAVISPYVTQGILEIKFTWPSGMRGTIAAFFESMIKGTEEVSKVLNNNPSINVALRQIILVVCNLIVFILMAFIMMFISWIIYLILQKYVLRDKKRKQTIEEIKKNTTNTFDLTPKPKKKYRLLGALVGAVQGFVLAFIIFLPISGLFATANQVLETATADAAPVATVSTLAVEGESADETPDQNEEALPATIGDLLIQNIPEEFLDIISSYRKTAIGAVGSVGDLDAMCFDTISTLKVSGNKIVLREEILNICNIYEDFVYVYQYEGEIKNLDFEKVDGLVDNVFSSNLVNAVLPDIIPYVLEQTIIKNDDFSADIYTGTIKTGVGEFVETLEASEAASTEISNDIKAFYEIFKLFAKGGIVDDIIVKDVDVEKILTWATATRAEGTVVTQSINHLMSTNTLNVALNTGVNIGIKALGEEVGKEIGTIKFTQTDWIKAKDEAHLFADNIVSVFNYYNSLSDQTREDLKRDEVDDQMENALKTLDLTKITVPVGKALDILNGSKVLNAIQGTGAEATPTIDIIIDSIYQSDMFESVRPFIRLNVANAQDFKFETEFNELTTAIEKMIDANIISTLTADEFNVEDLLEKYKGDKALTFDETFGKLLNSELFRPTFVSGINLLSAEIAKQLNDADIVEIGHEVDLAPQYADIKKFFNNLLPLSDSIFGDEGFTIDGVDTQQLTALMEGMKTNVYAPNQKYAKENAALKEIYTNIIRYLRNDEDYGTYFTAYYDDYNYPYDVDWGKLLEAVKIADKLDQEGTITPDDLHTVVDLIGENETLESVLKDTLKDVESIKENEELKGKIDSLDLKDGTTKEIVNSVLDLSTDLKNFAEGGSATVSDKVNSFINELDSINSASGQSSVNTVIEIVETLASEDIKNNSAGISTAEKNSITSTLEGAENLDEETKSKIKNMLGIGTIYSLKVSEDTTEIHFETEDGKFLQADGTKGDNKLVFTDADADGVWETSEGGWAYNNSTSILTKGVVVKGAVIEGVIRI